MEGFAVLTPTRPTKSFQTVKLIAVS